MRRAVFAIVSKIPPGKVATYGQIADALGTSPRAVGRILNSNEKLVEIPCHRVVMSDGRIGGYKCGVERKIELLESEGVEVKNGRVDLERFLLALEVNPKYD
ncbi:MAG: MGMT family protein [Candidatus Aenigmarchaeota archaeon]|nr:MGMT family protein [Candidatus Aenigmarchaeota archaeon]